MDRQQIIERVVDGSRRGEPYKVPVFVRYRVADGGVRFSLKMDRADVIEDTAFAELTKAIGEATAIDIYLGRR